MDVIRLPKFTRYVGIGYSGAETPEGLRVYLAEWASAPVEVANSGSIRGRTTLNA